MFQDFSIINRRLTFYLAGLFLCYCVACLVACPTFQLAMAVGAEIFAVVISTAIARSGIFNLRAPKFLPPSVASAITLISSVSSKIKCTALCVVALAATIDFAALACTIAKADKTAVAIQSAVPVSYWIGLHPAFTMEMLAGALVQSQNYDRAEPIYASLLQIRRNVCGANSDLVGAIDCDLGDFCVRKGELAKAENWYRQSVEQGVHTGRGSTGLATTLANEGKLEESAVYYKMALNTRQRIYGVGSKQYADTMRGYKRLQVMISEKANVGKN